MKSKPLILREERRSDLAFPNKLPSALLERPAPPTRVRSLTVWLILVGFGLFGGLIFWSTVAPIQSAVVAGGTFEVEGDLQVVDHLEGGVVREILVREGDTVEAGDTIARLDGTRTKAQLGILHNQLVGALSREARLKAEAAKSEHITYSDELQRLVKENPDFAPILEAQVELFASNSNSDEGERAIFDERIGQLNEQLAGTEAGILLLHKQFDMIEEELVSLEELLEKGLTLKARVVARREDRVMISGRIAEAEARRQSILQQIAEVRQRTMQIERARRLAIANDRQNVTELIYDIRQRIAATEDVLARQTIRAPIAGQIVGFQLNTIGETVEAGQELLRIVPRGQKYIVEAQVATSDIDEVILGGPVRVRLSAYSFRKTPPVNGVVTYISGDAFFSSSNDVSFYRIHVSIPEAEFAALPDVQALPGMPVQVMMATGEQTVMNYLLNPVLGGLETAMVEGE